MTGTELVNAALRQLGQIASGESGSPEELADGLASLNRLIGSWSAQGLSIPYLTREAILMNGSESYTLATRPLAVKAVHVLSSNGAGKDAEVVYVDRWAQVRDRAATGLFAEVAYYDAAQSSPKLWLNPRPIAGSTAEVYAYFPLAPLGGLGSSVDLPPGYEAALVFNLAVALAPEYLRGGEAPATLVGLANDAKQSIHGLNAAVLGTPVPPANVEAA
jgi:hypothetical protein